MTTFAINSWLLKLQVLRLKSSGLDVPQLTGVADGANRLIAGRAVEFFPGTKIGSLTSGWINNLPEIDPSLVHAVVLHREDMDLAIGQFGRICLLELGSDGVVDGIR